MKDNKIVVVLSLPLLALIIFVSYFGILTPGFYLAETDNWQAQSVGQDYIDLYLVAPVLLIAAVLAYKKYQAGLILWAGTITYILYTFLIYCFDIHFNRLFVLYCLILGLSFYSFVWFMLRSNKEASNRCFAITPLIKTTAIYFMIIAILFYFLWLSDILPALYHNITPASLRESGLITNPVHVIDLAIFLPGIFLTGLFLLKRKTIAVIIAPALLVFFVLMDISIGVLAIIMEMKNVGSGFMVPVIMGLLAMVSSVLLMFHLKITARITYEEPQ